MLIDAVRRALPDADDARVQRVAQEIGRLVHQFDGVPPAVHITRRQARDEASELHDTAAKLGRLLRKSSISAGAGMVGRIVSGRGTTSAETIARLLDDLALLRADLSAVVSSTDGDEGKLQINLPERGAAPDMQARRIASAALWTLFMDHARITAAADTSPAVQVVAAAFDLAGVTASARRQVADWLKRHPVAPDGRGRVVAG